jgi:hypothetical protein
MQANVVDTITRRAADQVTRRHSLFTLGGVVLAATAVAQPERASAKKKGKDCKKQERQRCKNDAEACRRNVQINCQIPEGCDDIAQCCDACNATGFITCVQRVKI